MLDTPGMQILAACCAPVFVKFLEELFPYSVGKQNCLTKKCNCFLKTCQILCPHEWVGFIWSWVLTNCRNEHAHAHGHTHTTTWEQSGNNPISTYSSCSFSKDASIYLSIYTYIYTHVYTNIVNHTLYIVYACAFIFANIDLLCIYIYIHMCVCVCCWKLPHMRYILLFSGCWELWWSVFPFLYLQEVLNRCCQGFEDSALGCFMLSICLCYSPCTWVWCSLRLVLTLFRHLVWKSAAHFQRTHFL